MLLASMAKGRAGGRQAFQPVEGGVGAGVHGDPDPGALGEGVHRVEEAGAVGHQAHLDPVGRDPVDELRGVGVEQGLAAAGHADGLHSRGNLRVAFTPAGQKVG